MVRAIMDAMNLKIDKAGRIVLPKQVRNRLRLSAGADLELEEGPEGLILRPVGQRSTLFQKNGLWVHMGKLRAGFHWKTMVDDNRDERLKDIIDL